MDKQQGQATFASRKDKQHLQENQQEHAAGKCS
jgi:hypothetical protein